MEENIVVFENVELFKDSSLKKSWCKDHMFDEDGFKVEIRGHKARAYSNQPFSRPRSRFAKLSYCGGSSGGGEEPENIFGFIVNGNKVFMRVKHSLK